MLRVALYWLFVLSLILFVYKHPGSAANFVKGAMDAVTTFVTTLAG
jgi:hypothetical protein